MSTEPETNRIVCKFDDIDDLELIRFMPYPDSNNYTLVVNQIWHLNSVASSFVNAISTQQKEIDEILKAIPKTYTIDRIVVIQGWVDNIFDNRCRFDAKALTLMTIRYMKQLSHVFGDCPVELSCPTKWRKERLLFDIINTEGYPVRYNPSENQIHVGDMIKINDNARTSSGRFVPKCLKIGEYKVEHVVGDIVYIMNYDNKYTFNKKNVTKISSQKYAPKMGDRLIIDSTSSKAQHIPIYEKSTSAYPVMRPIKELYIYDGKRCHGRYRVTDTLSSVGTQPSDLCILGWIDVSDIDAYGLHLAE